VALTAVAGLVAGCATTLPPGPPLHGERRFDLTRDGFAFANLVRAERPGLNDAFANYCLLMVRGASQFFRYARFEPSAPRVTPAEYTRLAREVMTRRPWSPSPPDEGRVVIPGYAGLRALSRDQEPAVKAAFGSNIGSMVDVRLWRVAVAFSPEHQAGLARELRGEVDEGYPVPLMVTNYPEEDLLNHAVLVYGYREEAGVTEFMAYDPNDPGSPFSLFFDRAASGFFIPPLTYSPPGRIRAFRLYTSILF
jgi:hypothetical protein